MSTVEPIGHIRTAHRDRASTPVQTALNPSEEGRVVLLAEFRDGLAELGTFDFAWLLTWLEPRPSDPSPVALRQTPFLMQVDRHEVGIFAMRGPRRPNPIGLHLVRIVSITDDGFRFAGVDMLDETPVLDVKPWAAPLDLPYGRTLDGSVRSGWFDTVDLSRPHTPESLARHDRT